MVVLRAVNQLLSYWLFPYFIKHILFRLSAFYCLTVAVRRAFRSGGRAGYFDKVGIIRVMQNHLLQVTLLLRLFITSFCFRFCAFCCFLLAITKETHIDGRFFTDRDGTIISLSAEHVRDERSKCCDNSSAAIEDTVVGQFEARRSFFRSFSVHSLICPLLTSTCLPTACRATAMTPMSPLTLSRRHTLRLCCAFTTRAGMACPSF